MAYIGSGERRAVWAFALVVMTLTSIPYLIGWVAQGNEWVFTGFLTLVDDGNSYLAKMRIGATGGWLFHLFYTSEPHMAAPFLLPYILLGKLAAPLGALIGLPVALRLGFHLARFVFGAVLIVTTHRFIAGYIRQGRFRWFALIAITVGGGLGWLLLPFADDGWIWGSMPVDMVVPEGFTFLVLYDLPHIALCRILMLGGFMIFERSLGRRWGWAALAGLMWAAMGVAVPFYVVVTGGILGVWGALVWVRRQRFPMDFALRGILAMAPALIPLGVAAYYFASDPVLAAWSAQNVLDTGHPLLYLFGYVVVGVPAVCGVIWAWRRGADDGRYLLLPAWVFASFTMTYIPVNVQRRLIEGVFVPLCVLAAVGLRILAICLTDRKTFTLRRLRRWLPIGVLALILPTTVLILLSGAFVAAHPAPPRFHPVAEVEAMRWLGEHVPSDSVVLCAYDTGNLLPVYADVRVFLGHGMETVDAERKEALVERFFAGEMSDDEVARLFESYGIDYVFYGVAEGNDGFSDPEWADVLRVVMDRGEYVIYEVPR